MATQMKLKVLFGGKSHGRPDNNKVVSFSALFFVFTLTWITEEELERVIEKKETNFVGRKTLACSKRSDSGERCEVNKSDEK